MFLVIDVDVSVAAVFLERFVIDWTCAAFVLARLLDEGTGELLAVITTSALELGIDIGDLDICLLVGYPGSIVATWQRGGRVGRSGRESSY